MDPAPEIIPASAIAPTSLPVPTAPAAASAAAEAPPPPSPAPAEPAGDVPRDAKGTPFDPAKHLAKQHPTTGRWLPKSPGRRAGSSTAANAGAGSTPPKPDAPPAPSFIPAAPPPPPEEADGKAKPGATAAPEGVDCSEEAGDLGAHALQFVAGILFDAFEDASCSPAEHKRMAQAFASYVRAKGWRAAAGAALCLVLVGYALRLARQDRIRAKVRTWMHGQDPAASAKNVTPPEQQPAPAPEKSAAAPVEVVPGTASEILKLYQQEQ